MARIRDEIYKGARNGVFLEYPIIDENGPLWKSRFPNMEAIEKLEKKVGNQVTWMREYMLRLIPDHHQLIKSEDIHYYTKIPDPLRNEHSQMIVGVDPAISEKSYRDKTAMVRITVIGSGPDKKMYVHGHPLNRQLDIVKTIYWIQLYNKYFKRPTFYIEQVAYQQSLVQLLEKSNEVISVKGIRPNGDKRERLSMIAYRIKSGHILFHNKACEELVKQLVNFGSTTHDDLVDALSLAVIAYEDDEPAKVGTVTAGSYRIGPNGGIIFGSSRRRY